MEMNAEEAWESLMRAHAKLEPLIGDSVEEATKLPLASFYILRALYRASAGLTMNELSDQVAFASTRTRVSRRVEQLTNFGLVERETNPDDGRSFFAVLTDEGRRRLQEALPAYEEVIEREVGSRATSVALRQLGRALDAFG